MEEFFLIYVNYVGEDWKGDYIYEFIFSDTTKGIDGVFWDEFPASSSNPTPPHEKFIKKVSKLESKLKLDVIQESSLFAVWDALDGIIALAWENIDDYEIYPKTRISFKFGLPIKEVQDKLYEMDLILEEKFVKK